MTETLRTASDVVVGIDLGTTNSEIAALVGDRLRVLGEGDETLLPSCVGLSPGGELLVGRAARNQQLLYPERTVRSIKRKMGSRETVTLGQRTFTPPEISALILRALVTTASRQLQADVRRAVITVPAFFTDAQRQATREAGAIAGLEVLRILNEPTAASLAYGFADGAHRCVLVYDLGGGTFDVSIVSVEGEITEVLASHGNTHLGGDDFDQLLVDRLAEGFLAEHGVDPRTDLLARSRLSWAAEAAKRQLSSEHYVTVREESLLTVDGRALHLERELSREEYEALITSLIDSTLESVNTALSSAGKTPGELDAVLLVGGSTRTPLISRVLEERIGVTPRQEVHPDLCVALGAGVLASRLGGQRIDRVLVDVCPHSFGVSHLGDLEGRVYPHCYLPIIPANTPLPVTRTERFVTSRPHQTEVEVCIYQGEHPDALKNVPVGNFMVEGLASLAEPNEVLCRMSLDLDGILRVSAIEKRSGKTKQITITEALQERGVEQIAAARRKLDELLPEDGVLAPTFAETEARETWATEASSADVAATPAAAGEAGAPPAPSAWSALRDEAERALARSRALLATMHDDDKQEAVGLHEHLQTAITAQDPISLGSALDGLKELLFFIEGR